MSYKETVKFKSSLDFYYWWHVQDEYPYAKCISEEDGEAVLLIFEDEEEMHEQMRKDGLEP